ncbi:MAG: hypothetical protein BGO01_11810 [Armatimonadetes bacterium 55-13]|nr:hypothetical protein [Armatimonadota bacterium]OJU63478.1 MAG: hypothetical protein BGO01_11810 [Armatimonadetes bacterium 55-13]
MILTALAAVLSVSAPSQGEGVLLARVHKMGEKLEYSIKSSLSAQHRQRGLETWIPEDFDINYGFTTEVKALKADGIADMIYKRPTMTMITGETFDSPPKTEVEKTNLNFLMTVSPANEILGTKDLNPPKKETPKKKGGSALWRTSAAGRQIPMIGQFIQEIHRLSLFAGSFDSSLDFSPRFPFQKLKVGDTWKRTVGYSPQKLKGKDGKTVVQRLDYTYTYKGVVDSNGKKVQRVEGDCVLNSDLATFINETFDVNSDVTGLKTIPLKFKAHIDFDLDPATMKTLTAIAQTEGGFQVIITDFPNDPVEEETFKGRTVLSLTKATIVKQPGAKTTPSKKTGSKSG